MSLQQHISKIILLLGLVSIPTCYIRANYNVPLLVFASLFWDTQQLKIRSRLFYIMIWSWFVDIIWIVTWLPKWQSENFAQYKTDLNSIVMIISIIIFVLKLILIIMLIFIENECRNSLKPMELVKNLKTFVLLKNQDESSEA